MSNSLEPCTRLKAPPSAPSAGIRRHWSLLLSKQQGLPGRSGPTVCGQQGAIDQERANYLMPNAGNRVRLHELRDCVACLRYVNHVAR